MISNNVLSKNDEEPGKRKVSEIETTQNEKKMLINLEEKIKSNIKILRQVTECNSRYIEMTYREPYNLELDGA